MAESFAATLLYCCANRLQALSVKAFLHPRSSLLVLNAEKLVVSVSEGNSEENAMAIVIYRRGHKLPTIRFSKKLPPSTGGFPTNQPSARKGQLHSDGPKLIVDASYRCR